MATTQRIIPPTYDKDGHVSFHSVSSPPDDSVALCYMIPTRVIPVIFVPGVMGSNLSTLEGKAVWLLDSAKQMAEDWTLKGAKARKMILDPKNTKVHDGGIIPTGTMHDKSELRRRGWGTVSYMSYGESLVWLENALNDFDTCKTGVRSELVNQLVAQAPGVETLTHEEVGLSYKYRFPVHAVGYNWLQGNDDSAKHLHAKIQEFVSHYIKLGFRCEKVILVTHSMGGLVARYYSEVLSQDTDYTAFGLREKVLGIVHGVMPTIGAAAIYKRMKLGIEGTTGLVAGSDAEKVTAVLSSAPGPLQLLPSPEYGMGWLKIKDGNKTMSLPKDDPYSEIYTERQAWWGLVDDKLINPLDPAKEMLEKDWATFETTIIQRVAKFHTDMRGKYHPQTYAFYGASDMHKAYGDISWRNSSSIFNDDLPREFARAPTTPPRGETYRKSTNIRFHLAAPEEPGDGTVPMRSGKAPASSNNVKACVPYRGVEHEPAYVPDATRRFALWAITKIAQNVKGTSLEYID
ncbi:lipase family alpha/beta hydrolase [Collimonas sp. NPDC087041]|uniref:lipase family alpha/beta hydrolase n=1 Tax=Collimonas sp. NPDC087041 TaxID=3363960 RepID=UPI00380E2CE7